MVFLHLIAAYGISFALMNDKAPFVPLLRRIDVVDRALQCSYCTGFHAGWLVWALWVAVEGAPASTVVGNLASAVVWAFAASAFCYFADVAAQRLEALAQHPG